MHLGTIPYHHAYENLKTKSQSIQYQNQQKLFRIQGFRLFFESEFFSQKQISEISF